MLTLKCQYFISAFSASLFINSVDEWLGRRPENQKYSSSLEILHSIGDCQNNAVNFYKIYYE